MEWSDYSLGLWTLLFSLSCLPAPFLHTQPQEDSRALGMEEFQSQPVSIPQILTPFWKLHYSSPAPPAGVRMSLPQRLAETIILQIPIV